MGYQTLLSGVAQRGVAATKIIKPLGSPDKFVVWVPQAQEALVNTSNNYTRWATLSHRNPTRERGKEVEQVSAIFPRSRVGLRCRIKDSPLKIVGRLP